MCGILGIFKLNKEIVTTEELNLMSAALAHRGPDDWGLEIFKNVGLGHRRLSIIDLSPTGKQPMRAGETGKEVWITFNGEIYNYPELKEELINLGYTFFSTSDTEVLLNLFREFGEDMLSKLRGMFSFAIYNSSDNSLFCARDRFGVKPFYYFKDKNVFTFASEIKALLSLNYVTRKPNNKMLYDFLVFNRTDHTEETCFKDIYNLMPGHFIKVSENNMEVVRWYSLPNLMNNKLSAEQNIAEFKNNLTQSIHLHMRSDVPVGSCLSGGLDSSSVVMLMTHEVPDPTTIHTFSAVYDKTWEKDESKYIESVIEKSKVLSHVVTPTCSKLISDLNKLIYSQEEPFSDTSIFASWCVMELASQNKVKVLLDGQGADELLGYDYMAAFYFYELLRKLKFKQLFKEMISFAKMQKFGVAFTMQLFGFLLLPKFLKKFASHVKSNWISNEFLNKNANESDFLEEFFSVSSLNQSASKHIQHKLTHLLRFEDKNSMAFSLETRVPYLDHELVEFALTVPSNLKIHSGILKYILRTSLKNDLPEIIYNRNNKIGFETPEHIWFNNPEIKKLIIEKVNSAISKEREYLNIQYVKKMLVSFENNLISWHPALWKILCLEIWFEVFFNE